MCTWLGYADTCLNFCEVKNVTFFKPELLILIMYIVHYILGTSEFEIIFWGVFHPKKQLCLNAVTQSTI